jgi:hypothetical protein
MIWGTSEEKEKQNSTSAIWSSQQNVFATANKPVWLDFSGVNVSLTFLPI